MSLANFVFSEMSPNAATTAISSQPVQNAASYLPAGVAGPLDEFEAVDVTAELAGATGGTLDVYVQTSPDGGGTWYDAIHFPQLLSGASAVKYKAPVSLACATTAPSQVGKNGTPVLANAKVVGGAFSDRMRLVMVAGVGTTAGAPLIVRLCAQRSVTKLGK
jgi:hypothetical protein